MGKIFHMDGPLFRGLNKVADALLLTLLLWVSAVTVVGFGIGLTAAFTVVFKLQDETDHGVFRDFFTGIRRNVKQALLIWLLLAVIGVVLFWDWQLVPYLLDGQLLAIVRYLLMVAGLLWAMELLYVFPLLARFDNTTGQTMKNALLMSIRYFPYTVGLLALAALPFILLVLVPQSTGMILFFILMLWPGTWVMLHAKVMQHLLKPFMPKQEENEEDKE
ncbi:MAG: DUF624 domain-containing protein [Eubacteriales bacterium]|nr:DUF624 domain-containing protein [Eubacteriales bacterium]